MNMGGETEKMAAIFHGWHCWPLYEKCEIVLDILCSKYGCIVLHVCCNAVVFYILVCCCLPVHEYCEHRLWFDTCLHDFDKYPRGRGICLLELSVNKNQMILSMCVDLNFDIQNKAYSSSKSQKIKLTTTIITATTPI